MPDDVVLKLVTVYDGSQLAEGLRGSTTAVEADTGAWKEAFASMAANITESNAALATSIRELNSSISTIPVATKAAAAESEGALTLLQEKFVETAEAAKLSAAGVGGAFSGVGALLGGGLIIGLMGHLLDETAKEVLELGHLSDKTGVTIEALSGLQRISRELGINFESLEQGIIRLERAQALAVEGGKMQAEAFARIGLSVQEIKNLSPEELFNTVSGAIQRSGSSADVAASAIALFGRGGAALIPVFKQYGDTLTENTRKLGEENGVTNEAYQNALKLQKVEADLGAEVRKVAIEILPGAIAGWRGFIGIIDEARAAIGEIIIKLQEWDADAKAIQDVEMFRKSWGEALNEIKENAGLARIQVAQLNAETAKAVRKDLGVPESTGLSSLDLLNRLGLNQRGGAEGGTPSGAGAPSKGPTRLEEWKLELQQREDLSNASHVEMLSQELVFWDNILNTQKLKAQEELEVRHQIATLNKEVTGQMHADSLRSYEESAREAGAGSAKEIEILRNKAAFAAEVYGPFSSEAIHAYDEVVAASRKAALAEMKDSEDAAKQFIKSEQEKSQAAQKRMEEAFRQQSAEIVLSSKQESGKGGLGSIPDVATATAELNQLRAAQISYEISSRIEAATTAQEKINKLREVRSAIEVDAGLNAANAQADASKLKALDLEILTAKEEADRQQTAITARGEAERFRIKEQYQRQLEVSQQRMAQSFSSELDTMIFHTRSFGAAMQRLWQDMVSAIIRHGIQLVAQHAAQQASMAAATAAGQAAQTAATAAGSASRSGIGLVEAIKSIGHAAAVSAAHAFKSVMEKVPFPANVVLAPLAAAGAFAAVLAFGASAEKGFDVGDSPVGTMLHPREMVLPADLAGGVRNMVSSQSSTTKTSASTIFGAPVSFQYSPNIQSGMDPAQHGDAMFSHFMTRLRLMGAPV